MIVPAIRQFRLFSRRLWVRAALVSLSALVAASLAPLSNYLPFRLADRIDAATLQDLLDILTNSMLTVTTFSLSIMVAAHLAADSSTTPRAHRLLQQDPRTQTVLATFIGAFVYALALTIMLSTGLFAPDEMALIYFFTVGVIAFVVLAILRWVGHLDGLGSVEATARSAEESARGAIAWRAAEPFLGARPQAEAAVPEGAHEVRAAECGYVAEIETAALSSRAGAWGGTVHLAVTPGDWVVTGDVLARVAVADWSEARAAQIRAAILVEDRRRQGQDTAFSLVVLAEIGERALSPGINDPRTGIDVIGRITRLILSLPPERALDAPRAPHLRAPGLDPVEMLRTTLDPLARDGKDFHEVAMAVQRAAAALSRHGDPGIAGAARGLSARALSYAREGGMLREDLERVAAAAPGGDGGG